ncbi:Chorismate mutase [Methylomagnum ishizawai]|uniref:chorismate mutase n=1 Tax=Methylomagnum ishizawai TaxID=1760988 RepID=A0A1Y6D0E4_9GAMM|nr:chorismate mutase [Methylomagnum ishizawai]SMF94303.1 Chorismate mutase [Methylomagnum ishizawai]
MLETGRVDAVISDTLEAATWDDVALLGPFTQDRKAMALPLDHVELRDRIDDWLAARETDGWLPQQRQALGAQAAMAPEQVCAEAISANLSQRFSLMPWVAAVKRRESLPIIDPAQEAKVLAQARAMAAREGLPENEAARLFTVLMELSKSIQARNGNAEAEGLGLPELRLAVAGVSSALLPEIRRYVGILADHSEMLETTLRHDLGEWLDADKVGSLLEVLPPRAFGSLKSKPRRAVQ